MLKNFVLYLCLSIVLLLNEIRIVKNGHDHPALLKEVWNLHRICYLWNTKWVYIFCINKIFLKNKYKMHCRWQYFWLMTSVHKHFADNTLNLFTLDVITSARRTWSLPSFMFSSCCIWNVTVNTYIIGRSV